MKKLYSFIACCFFSLPLFAQTVAIDPAGNGGFESGTTLAANGWTAVNSAFNQWVVGTGSVGHGTRGAYIGNSTSFFGTNNFAINHFYRDIAIPAGATNVKLKFKYFQPVTDAGWDSFYVSTTTTANTPVAGVAPGAAYTRRFENTNTVFFLYTSMGPYDLSALAGTTVRLVFTHKNDGSSPIGVPAVDSISLTYCNLPGITGTAVICPSGATTLSNTTGGGTWSSGSTGIATIDASTGAVTGVAPGTTVITYTAGTCTTTRILTVSALPVLQNVTGGGTVCSTGGTGVHIGLDGSETGVDYELSDGTSVVATVSGTGGAIDFGTFTTAGSYTASAMNTTTTCTNNMTGSAVVSVASPVTPSVAITPDVTDVCSGTPVTFTATPVNGGATPSYQWTVNGIATGIDAATHTYSPANGDVVGVTLTPGGICTDPATVDGTYTVSIAPSLMPSVAVTVNPGNPSCLGKPVTFTAIPSVGGSAPAYLWNRNGINVATGPSFICTPANGDIIFCTMTSNYDCRLADDVASSSITMTVVAGMPAPTVNIAATPGTHIAAGQLVSLHAAVTGGTSPVSYLWYVNGAPVGGATSSTYESNTLNNGDIVTCKVMNSDVCANATLKSVTITVGDLGVNGVGAVAGGLTISPNPNTGLFFVKGAFPDVVNGEVTVVITNMLGQVVYNALVPVQDGMLDDQVNLAKAAPGIYTINVHSGAGNKVAHFVLAQ